MTGLQAVLNDIISLLGGSIGAMGKQIGEGLGDTVSAIFLKTNIAKIDIINISTIFFLS